MVTNPNRLGEPGFIYVIGPRNRDGMVKIGWSKAPKRRLATLQVAHPEKLSLLATVPGTQAQEKTIHWRCRAARKGGEWFIRSNGVEVLIRDMRDGKPADGLALDAWERDAPTIAARRRRQKEAEAGLIEKGLMSAPKDARTGPRKRALCPRAPQS